MYFVYCCDFDYTLLMLFPNRQHGQIHICPQELATWSMGWLFEIHGLCIGLWSGFRIDSRARGKFEDEVEGEDFSCVEVLGAKLKMMTWKKCQGGLNIGNSS